MEKRVDDRIDNLAGVVQRGFVDLEERLGSRIDGVETRLGSRIDGVEARLVNVENRLDKVVLDIADMKRDILKKLEQKVDKVDFTKLKGRVAVLEKVILKQK